MSAPVGLEALRDRFVAGLPKRAAALEAALDQAARGYDSVYNLMVKFHALAGVAGMYGLAEVTAAARRAELLCDRVLGMQRTLTRNEVQELRAIIADSGSAGVMAR